jgi:hypothetical protein
VKEKSEAMFDYEDKDRVNVVRLTSKNSDRYVLLCESQGNKILRTGFCDRPE